MKKQLHPSERNINTEGPSLDFSSTMKLFLLTLFALTLTVTGKNKLIDFLLSIYFTSYFFISQGAPDKLGKMILSSGNGPSREQCPDCLGEYHQLPEDYNGKPAFRSLPRDGRNVRYVIYIGNNIIYNCHNIVLIFHTRIRLVHHT